MGFESGNFGNKNRGGGLSYISGNTWYEAFKAVVSYPECSLGDLEKIIEKVFGYLNEDEEKKEGTKMVWKNFCEALKDKSIVNKDGKINKARKKAIDYFWDILQNDRSVLDDFWLLEKMECIFWYKDIDLNSKEVNDFIDGYVFAPSDSNKQTSLYRELKRQNKLVEENDMTIYDYFKKYNEKVRFLEDPFVKIDTKEVTAFLESIEDAGWWIMHDGSLEDESLEDEY